MRVWRKTTQNYPPNPLKIAQKRWYLRQTHPLLGMDFDNQQKGGSFGSNLGAIWESFGRHLGGVAGWQGGRGGRVARVGGEEEKEEEEEEEEGQGSSFLYIQTPDQPPHGGR